MRRILATLAPFAALGLLGAPAVAMDDDGAKQTRGEKQLERMLKGRVAGEPERCIRLFPRARMTIVDGQAIVVRVGQTVYVNTTTRPETLDDGDFIVHRRFSGDNTLCERETLETYSRMGGDILTGIVSLGEFVPYTREDSADEG